MSLSEIIAENLLALGAVKVSIDPPFTWTSGIKSPIYCDNRKMISFVEQRRAVIEGFMRMIVEKGIVFDVIGGTATAAIPWAAFLAYELDKPLVYIRPEKKEHGAGKQIEGDLAPGQRVLIVEDLISTGGSSVNAALAVREEGKCLVSDIFCIVTYGFPKAVSAFEAAELKMHPLTNFETLVKVAAEKVSVSEEDLAMVLEFAKEPESWNERMKELKN